MEASQTSPIGMLEPEILLEIFDKFALDCDRSNQSLVSSILCCRKWHPLASSVLYRHVVLDDIRLEQFVNNRMRCDVRSLTVALPALGCNLVNAMMVVYYANARKANLQKLRSLIGDIKPATLSISVDMPFPCTAAPEIASILNSLPERCTALEIDMRHGSKCFPDIALSVALGASQDPPHMCDSIRAVLPRLKHLRLRLPVLCSAIFSASPLSQDLRYQAICTPLLKTCLINLALRLPGSDKQGAWAIKCGDHYNQTPHIHDPQLEPRVPPPSALPPMELVLRDFAVRNSSNLERLWVMETKTVPQLDFRDHLAWIRRDFLSNASYPIPFWKVEKPRYRVWGAEEPSPGDHIARAPSHVNPEETEDWVSELIEDFETLAEGKTWAGIKMLPANRNNMGPRLPTRDVQKYKPQFGMRSRAEYQKRGGVGCLIWRHEDRTGKATLPQGPGELMQQWDLLEMRPYGWRTDSRGDWVRT